MSDLSTAPPAPDAKHGDQPLGLTVHTMPSLGDAVAQDARRTRAGRWQMILPPAFHAVLLSGGNGRESKSPWVVLGIAWLLAVVALLGPSWQRVEQSSQKPADP